MAHGHLVPTRDRFEATPEEWLKAGMEFSELTRTWAKRDDILSFIGKGATAGVAIACWVPAIAEMEINVDKAFGEEFDPSLMPDFRQRRTHFDYPAVAGAILHEAMHARHTKWLLSVGEDHPDLSAKIFDLVMLFEETRIERMGMVWYPENRSFLRAEALKFSLDEALEIGADKLAAQGALGVSKLALLSLARWDIGVLEFSDVEHLWNVIKGYFGEELLTALREVWFEAQRWSNDEDVSGLVVLAEKWVQLLEDAGHSTEPRKPTKEEMEFFKKLLEQFGKAAEKAGDAGTEEAHGQMIIEVTEEQAEKIRQIEEEKSQAKESASRVYGNNSGPPTRRGTRSTLEETREPTSEERRAAVIIANKLRVAKHRDRVVTKRRSEQPPGRLNGRWALQRDVQIARGQIPTAEPWVTKKRRHVEEPKLRIGLLADISGSMNPAMEPVSVSSWLFSAAAKQLGAEISTVYYGNSVFPVLKPGEYLDKVYVYGAHDGTEEFDLAFKAINGEMNLLNSSGARLLVIASDMRYRPEQQAAVKKWLRRCDQEGVATMSLPIKPRETVDQLTAGTKCQVVEGTDPVALAMKIGEAAAQALTTANGRR